MDEYFDIVDENNTPTGEKRLRSEAHSQGLWHRTVHIYLFRQKEDDLEFLVHLRSKTKDLHPNEWDTRFGGHVKSGDTVEETVISELKEEINLDTNLDSLIQGEIYKHDGFPNKEFVATYYCNFTGDKLDLKFSDNEVQKVKWMSIKDIIDAMKEKPGEWTSKPEKVQRVVDVLKSKLGTA